MVPGGDEQLVVRSDNWVHILARDMSVVSSFELQRWLHRRQQEFIYATETTGDGYIHCFTRAGTEVVYEDPDKRIAHPVPRPVGCSSACSSMMRVTTRRTRSPPSTPRRCSLATGLAVAAQ